MNTDVRQSKFCYSINCQTYQQSLEVPIAVGCNGWTAINNGDTRVTVENIELLPALAPGATGAAIQIGGNLGELYAGRIQILFDQPTGVNPSVQIIQKFYANPT